MKKNFKELREFFIVTVIFAWSFWLLSMYVAIKSHTYIPLDDRIFTILLNGFNNTNQQIASVLFFIGTLGPLVGALYIKFKYKKEISLKIKKFDYKYLLLVILFPIVLLFFSLIIPALIDKLKLEYIIPISSMLKVLLIQLVFSFFTIIGWFCCFYPVLEKKYKIIKASYLLGLVWSLNILPIIIYISYHYHSLYTFFNVVGLIATTLPLSLALAWIYDKTKNVALVIFAYAWFKTILIILMSLTLELVIPTMIFILGLWLVNYYLIETNKQYL